jgi:hypothetical protein
MTGRPWWLKTAGFLPPAAGVWRRERLPHLRQRHPPFTAPHPVYNSGVAVCLPGGRPRRESRSPSPTW